MKRMKKWLAVLAALCLLSGMIPAGAETAAEKEALPQAGDVIHGFEAKEIRAFDAFGATLVLFEHQATGAKLIYAANDDTNRAFQLTFLTRPLNDMGLPHVFEHATLYGSEKYPSKTLFFNMMYQTYNTYINAYTTDAMTGYPLASLSEAQLLKLADWYTDSCLHPNIMTDESIYRTQAWHYELADAESPLTVEGTVYSEMTGALTLERMATNHANRVTFPGAALTFDYGGIPDAIMEMTWEDLKAYHDRYYHPSNCLALLYGSLDRYSDFLKLLDDAFAGYDRQEFTHADEGYQRITEPVTAEFAYPVEAGASTANQSAIIYYIVLPELRAHPEAQLLVDHLTLLLNYPGSPLHQKLTQALPTGSFSVGREVAAPDDAVVFQIQNVNREDAETFRFIVDSTLKDIAENGLDPVLAEAAATSVELTNKLASESGDPVNSILASLAYSYATTGQAFGYVDTMEAYGNIMEEYRQGLLQQAAGDWLTDPALYTLTTTYPAPGEKEKEAAALAEKLAEIKAGMSPEEIQAIVEETSAQPPEENNAAMVASLQAVHASSLPEEVRVYDVEDIPGADGVRRINVTAGVDGVDRVQLYLDASALPVEDIHYMQLFTQLLGKMDTDAHSREELSVLMSRYLNSAAPAVAVLQAESGDVLPFLTAQWTALDADLEKGYDLIDELLFHTDFGNLTTLAEQITARKADTRSLINASPYLVSLMRALGSGVPAARYYDYLNYTAYYAFLEGLEAQMQEAPEAVAARLEGVQRFFRNRSGAVAAFAGNPESIRINQPLADAFMAKLEDEPREKAAPDLPAPAASEGLIVDANIGFNTLAADFGALGVEPDGALNVICGIIVDKILAPVLRDQMGVYTPECTTYSDWGLCLISFRDPNVRETFDVYRGLPEKIAAMEISEEELEGYIMSSYSSLAKPQGELTGAAGEITRILQGKPADETLTRMRQMKQVTPDSLKKAADIFQTLWEKGYRGTAAGAGTVQANADLYEAILNPFAAVDAGAVTLTDVGEDREDYEAIRFAYENNLMALTGENAFSPDAPATVGDLFAALYALIGGAPNAPEEAIAAFAQLGLAPEGTAAADALTFAFRDQTLSGFGALAGVQFPAIGEGRETETMTRGQLAQDLKSLSE